jgi:hypothetical protein
MKIEYGVFWGKRSRIFIEFENKLFGIRSSSRSRIDKVGKSNMAVPAHTRICTLYCEKIYYANIL